MCGIIGHISLDDGPANEAATTSGLDRLLHRGPDNHGTLNVGYACLGHSRLSVLDVSEASNQPFTDESGRFALTYNGEIYNYRALRDELKAEGVRFKTSSDTEVLLHLLIQYGKAGIEKLNGFFAFCFVDTAERYSLLARDRMGIKPLFFSRTKTDLYFSSELKALLSYDIPKELDPKALNLYFQLNYIPAPLSVIQNVYKLTPGSLVEVKDDRVSEQVYYSIPWNDNSINISYLESQERLRDHLNHSVELRMVSDVPIGCFLSGGIDSSVISTLAASKTPQLQTYSIGYADNPFFDETRYAELVASKIGSRHRTFKLTNEEILKELPTVLGHFDEPFADSSAIAVHMLSERTRQEVTVALSGDGADELFSGYNKHAAEWVTRNHRLKTAIARRGKALWSSLPRSRNSGLSNFFRKMDRFANGASLSPKDRYWSWASILSTEQAQQLLKPDLRVNANEIVDSYTSRIAGGSDMNDVLYADCALVLPNDMLAKVDKMSMAHGLEVRTPFLDHHLVDFAFELPSEFKINGSGRKRVLRDAFKNQLPSELYQRPKQGFEIPLLSWMTGALSEKIKDHYLSECNDTMQRILSMEATVELKSRLFSSDPGDSHATVWAVMVLDHWLNDILT